MKNVRRVVNVILIIAMLIFLALGLREIFMYSEVEDDKEALVEIAVKIPKDSLGVSLEEEPFERYIDFEALHKINPDIVGWIYIPDTQVDYPIMVGDTNEEYLSKNYNGGSSKAGSIFAFAGVDLTEDRHVCMFGHNLRSGQMFGGLRNYKDSEYAGSHMKMYIYTPDRVKECTLISVFGCDKWDSVFELNKTGKDADTVALQKSLTKRSTISLDETVEGTDTSQIFTLGTCNGKSGSDNRLAVNFLVTRERYVID